ncbi:MAG: TlpA family protein disulfide reductase [Gammaproteobacteria bacterium]|nr:TlpA family protein disulfide reductase [Gammaproteobacteria bacterium]
MNYTLKFIAVSFIVAGFALGGYMYTRAQQGADAKPLPITASPPRPDFVLPDLSGVRHHASEWDGKVLLINFWATWCPPCLREIPAFVELQKDYGARGLQIVGIALDNTDAVRKFVATHDMGYPVLVGDGAANEASLKFGDLEGALPYTAIVDRKGNIIYTHAGEISRERVEKVIGPLL